MSVAIAPEVPTVAIQRRVVVCASVRGRDLGSFVIGAQAAVKLPARYWIGWSGQFERFISTSQRLAIVVPIVLAPMTLLLSASLGSAEVTAILITGALLWLAGGVADFAQHMGGRLKCSDRSPPS